MSKNDYQWVDIADIEPDFLWRCIMVVWYMDYLSSPTGDEMARNLSTQKFEQWQREYSKQWVEFASKETGIDPEKIKEFDGLTIEQKKELTTIPLREQLCCINSDEGCNYYSAIKSIKDFRTRNEDSEQYDDIYCRAYISKDGNLEEKGAFPYKLIQKADFSFDNIVSVPLAAVVLFFMIHSDIEPMGKEGLTSSQEKVLQNIFMQMDAFYREHVIDIASEQQLLYAFTCGNGVVSNKTFISKAAKKPTRHYDVTHKAMEAIKDASQKKQGEETELGLDVVVSRRKSKSEIVSHVFLAYRESGELRGMQQIGEYEQAVFSAVSTLYCSGNKCFTIPMVWRCMNGKRHGEKMPEGERQSIIDAIEKMRHIDVKIDCINELVRWKLCSVDGDPAVIVPRGDYFLNLKPITVYTVKNKPQDGYEIVTAPIMLIYSQATGKIINEDIGLLDIKRKLKDGDRKGEEQSVETTRQRTALKHFILRRVAGMKHDNNLKSECISINSIYEAAEHAELNEDLPADSSITDKNKRKNVARSIRDDTELILDNFVSNGFIIGYREYTKGKRIAGYRINYKTDRNLSSEKLAIQ